MNGTRFKVYKHAYWVRLSRGESLSSIDELYRTKYHLTEDEIKEIHKALGI